jgi:hypothetical protein
VVNFVRKLKRGTNNYKCIRTYVLIVMVLVIFLLNVLMLRIKVVVKNKILRRKIKFKRETREATKIIYSRKFYIQMKTTLS